MNGKYPGQHSEPVQFVYHTITNQVGVLMDKTTRNTETRLTVRLAGGNLLSAPAGEFRPATESEIARRHETAALTRPLDLPPLPLADLSNAPLPPMHRPGV